jgi:hypothetical protein
MIVKTLEKMEKIVASNKELSWSGWTVLHSSKSDLAQTSKHGVRINNSWYLQKQFAPTRDGWNIPDKFVR